MADSDPTQRGALRPRDVDSHARQQLRAWLDFQSTLGLKLGLAARCLAQHGDPDTALRASGLSPKWSRREIDEAVDTLAEIDAIGLPVSSDAYPRALRTLSDAPPLLWLRGSLSDLEAPCVAIVGSRAATAYGLDVAARLAAELAEAGVVVISGLARGIDAAAHAGALDAGGRTIAVQACGPERVYPAAHRKLATRIRENGAVLTELPPGMRPRPAFFPLRNRMISALAQIVVVVEARLRSGSLITARHALDQGGEVMAVPGPISAPTSAGTNALLRDGAAPVAELADVLRALGIEAAAKSPARETVAGEAAPLLAAVRAQPRSRDELQRDLKLRPGELDLRLLELELEGLIAESRDGRWLPVGSSTG